jgi:hypothetical protein
MRRELDLGELGVDDRADFLFRDSAALAQRKGDVVEHAERGKERAVLEQHSPSAGAHRAPFLKLGSSHDTPNTRTDPATGCFRPEDHAQQLRLAAARAADQRHDLVAPHSQVQVLVQDLPRPDGVDQALDLDHMLVRVSRHCARGSRKSR